MKTQMPATTSLLESGPISVLDYRCGAGPGDKPFVESHQSYSIAYVRKGSFGCHVRSGCVGRGARRRQHPQAPVPRLPHRLPHGRRGRPHHNASMQILADGDGCRAVRIADLLPNDLAGPVAGMIDQGPAATQKTLVPAT